MTQKPITKTATSVDAPLIFAHWERFVTWLLPHTEKFPRRVAMTFRTRIDNLALDVYERLVDARYTRDRAAILNRINLDLEKLRLLLRLSHEQRILDPTSFRHACVEIDTTGRMVGGWRKYEEQKW